MFKNIILSLAVLVTICSSLNAQDQVTTNLLSYINNIIDSMPESLGGDQYQEPSSDDLNKFKGVLELILDQQYYEADVAAADIGYKLVQISDISSSADRTFYVLQSNSTNYWGTFVFKPDAERSKVIIQCPHSLYDSNTGKQGTYVFRYMDAFALFLNGTHRCNSSIHSSCSGTTSACGSGYESYRISDQAHNVNSTFQAATVTLDENIDSLIFVQLHGFTMGNTDPNIIMSNGTSMAPSGTDYLSIMKEEFSNINPALTYKIAHIDDWTRLIATTNTQGRYLNGSSEPCTQAATSNSGRFLHLEQSRTYLRNTESDWYNVAKAFAATFPKTNISGIEDDETLPQDFTISCYPNPFNPTTNIQFTLSESSTVTIELYNSIGQKIKNLFNGVASSGQHKIELNGGNLSSGIYFVLMNAGRKIVSNKIVLLK